MTPDQALIDEFLVQALEVLRLSAGFKRAAFARIAVMQAALVQKLSDQNLPDASKAQIDAVLSDASDIISTAYATQAIDLTALSVHVAGGAATALENVLTIALGGDAAALPSADYLASLASDVMIQGAPSSAWWAAQDADLQFKFAAQVRQGLSNGETNQQIIRRIVGSSDVPGIMDTARANAASLVQTSVQTVANDARLATFKANSRLIKGVKQISTLDSHTSLICIAYSDCEWDLDGNPINGTTLPFNGGTPRHFNCRSVLVPITKTFKDMGLNIPEPVATTRASTDGPVSAKTTFNDFLNRKGAAFQDKVLGKGRADLWRDGKITLRDLVNGEGNPLTLAELRANT